MPGVLPVAALLSVLAANAAANAPLDIFPESEKVFRQLTADPRRIQLGAAYYRLDGKDRADAALGYSWGMARWRTQDESWSWQWNIEGMAYSRFTISGSLNSFETVDFVGNLPVSARHGGFSARAMLFHESSHLGDDYIRRTGDQGFRYSIDGARLTLSSEPFDWLRAYCGSSYLLHTVPDPARRIVQAGIELTTRPLRWRHMRVFGAQDVQFREDSAYRGNWRTVAGIIVGIDGAPRAMRAFVGRFDGRSPFGQFYRRRERYTDIGLSFQF